MNILELIVNKNDYNEFLQIAITSYYNILQNNKNKEYLVIDIEKKCADGNNKKDYCINYIIILSKIQVHFKIFAFNNTNCIDFIRFL